MKTPKQLQQEVVDFVKSLGIEADDIVVGKDWEVSIPSKKVAIEVSSLAWEGGNNEHSFDRKRRRAKYQKHLADSVKLFQFFSDEWDNKGEICKSMVANALGVSKVQLHARDCEVKPISSDVSKQFVNDNHISGSTRAKHHLGLFHKKLGLVGVASTRTPIQKRHGHCCELARMCFLRGANVRGGASKLLEHVKEVAKQDGFESLLSYAELRYGSGNVYLKCGFDQVSETTTNYWYADGTRRYDRFKFRAQPGKPEKLVAEEAKVRSVWGAGNRVYLFKF